MRPTAFKLSLVVSAIALLGACSSQPPAPEQNPVGVVDGSKTGVGGSTTSPTTVAPVTATGIDPTSLAALKDPKSAVFNRSIFFDYDQYTIKDEFKPLVDAHAKLLAKNPGIKMMIQGNADERGSREYNLALGQKRADAVKRSLALLGVKDDQIESVSLGEEKPKNPGHDESAWSENRRADILYKAPDGRGEF